MEISAARKRARYTVFCVRGPAGKSRNRSKIQFGPKLKDSWIEGACHLAKIARSESTADLVELGVVPRVEAFRAKFEPAAPSFVDHETLEQRKVPIVATRAAERVMPRIAPAAHRWIRERIRVEPLGSRVRIREVADLIRPIGGVGQTVATLAARQLWIDWHSGSDGHDTGDFPSADG